MAKNSRRKRGRPDREVPKGLSEYAKKVEAREAEPEEIPATPTISRDDSQEGILLSRGNYQYETVIGDVPIEMRYHRTAVKAVCTAQDREIYSVFFNPRADYVFSIKQAGRPEKGKGNVLGENFFEDLYQAWWAKNSPQARKELRAIEAAFRKTAGRISERLGLEFSLN